MTTEAGFDDALGKARDLLRQSGRWMEAGLRVVQEQVSNRTRVYGLEADAPGLPKRLILKLSGQNRREVAFYRAAGQHGLPAAPCFGAEFAADGDSASNGCNALLLADLSETHCELGELPAPVSSDVLRAVVEALAGLQAFGWQRQHGPDNGLLVELPGVFASQECHEEFLGYLTRDAHCYLDAMQGKLTAAEAGVYDRAIANLRAGFAQRFLNRDNLAMVHGDLHPGNIFLPKQAGQGVCFIDWEAYRLDLPTTDLATLLGLYMLPNAEAAMPLLRAYHARLTGSGVAGYSFEDMLRDYRTSLLYGLFYPMKLFCLEGIHDAEMIANASAACHSFACL